MPAALKEEIAAALNEIIEKPVYDGERFADVKLSEPVRELLTTNPQKQNAVRLNRRLLEEAYPQEITRIPVGSQTTFGEGDKRKYLIAGTEKPLVCKWIKPKLVRFNNRRRDQRLANPDGASSIADAYQPDREYREKITLASGDCRVRQIRHPKTGQSANRRRDVSKRPEKRLHQCPRICALSRPAHLLPVQRKPGRVASPSCNLAKRRRRGYAGEFANACAPSATDGSIKNRK